MPYADTRKINPVGGTGLRPVDVEYMGIRPSKLALDEWAIAGLKLPDMASMRAFRLDRIIQQLARRDYCGVLLFDPLNIRYATDSTNMQVWNLHNPFRACLVCSDGYIVLWDYKNSPFLAQDNPLIREVRHGASMFYFAAGEKIQDRAHEFVDQVVEILQSHSGNNRRLAVDKIMVKGANAFESKGYRVHDGEQIMEHSRSIKGPDEILAMRCAIHAGEQSVRGMEWAATPGLSENDIWSVLHAENIRRGGEWIETRLLSSGPRTNPWFQECGPRVVQNNEILAFDTDLIGCYGMCVDISRTWFIGDGLPDAEMIDDYNLACEHIMVNMELLKPGTHFDELTHNCHRLPDAYQAGKYSCCFHGVGLCDEWPLISYPDEFVPGAFDGVLAPGMVMCVEALVSHSERRFSVKLEEQVLVTENGFENLTSYPFDKRLLGPSRV